MTRRALPPLPTRDGVGPSCVALPAGPWATVGACLADRLPSIAPAVWAVRIAAGDVVDEHGVPIDAERPHRGPLRAYYYRAVGVEPRVAGDEAVLFHDDRLVVADKPHFLPVTPSGGHLQETLLVRLKRRLGIATLVPLHRIDRETAGLVMFSVDPATRGAYQRLFAMRSIAKHYECIAPWNDALAPACTVNDRLVDDPLHFMRMMCAPGPANARTRLDLAERRGALARWRLVPLTGRRHQLRVHCAGLGMPILGDRIYPTLQPENTDDAARPLQLLAASLAFTDPVSGEPRRFTTRRSLDWHAGAV